MKKLKQIKVYRASDESLHENLIDYQRKEISLILLTVGTDMLKGVDPIIQNREAVVDILSIKERKPRAKEAKPRKALGRSSAVPKAKEVA